MEVEVEDDMEMESDRRCKGIIIQGSEKENGNYYNNFGLRTSGF